MLEIFLKVVVNVGSKNQGFSVSCSPSNLCKEKKTFMKVLLQSIAIIWNASYNVHFST